MGKTITFTAATAILNLEFCYSWLVVHTQCENYWNLLTHNSGKTFVKVTSFSQKKLLNSWFDEIFSVRVISSFFYSVGGAPSPISTAATIFTYHECIVLNFLIMLYEAFMPLTFSKFANECRNHRNGLFFVSDDLGILP